MFTYTGAQFISYDLQKVLVSNRSYFQQEPNRNTVESGLFVTGLSVHRIRHIFQIL